MIKTFIALAAAATLVGAAHAKTPSSASASAVPGGTFALVVDVGGWETYAGFGGALNTEAFYEFAPGTQVFGFDYNGITFTTANGSWGSELTLSVNDSEGNVYLDWRPDTTEAGGTFGPLSGTWGGTSGAAGPFGAGDPFSLPGNGILWVTVYESFTDPNLNATISSGTLTIYTSAAPIPEPATYGLMGLGLLGVAAAARRRKAD